MKKSLIPIFLLSGAILTGCGWNNDKEVQEFDSVLNEALTTMDISKCETLLNENYKESCVKAIEEKINENKIVTIENEASRNADPSLCDQIEDENTKTSCVINATSAKEMKK